MEANCTSTSQRVEERKMKNLHHSLAASKYRVFSLYLMVLCTFSTGVFGDDARKPIGTNESNLDDTYSELMSVLAEHFEQKLTGRLNNISAEVDAMRKFVYENKNRSQTSVSSTPSLDQDNTIILKGQLTSPSTGSNSQRSGDCRCYIDQNWISNFVKEEIEKKVFDQSQLVKTIVLALEHTLQIKHLGEALADLNRVQSADTQRISSETERMRVRLDREESISSQLTEKVSIANKEIKANSQLISAGEAERNALKNEFADFRDQTEKMRRRLDQDENTASQLAEKVSGEDKKVESLAERIRTEEAISEALIRFAVGNESTTILPRGTGQVDWILDNYKSRVQDPFIAGNESDVATVGPSFYTKGLGYKIGIRHELRKRGHFLAVYPLAGVYDQLLKWPLVGDISIAFVDQSELSKNTTYRRASFYTGGSDPCKDEWGRIFDDKRRRGCLLGVMNNDDLKKKNLIKNDFLHIRVEVVMN